MRRHAKALAAGFTNRSANRPAGRGRRIVLAISLVALASLALSPAAFAGKSVDRFVSGAGTGTLGSFASAADIAVYEATGDVYVAENNRIQRFSAAGVPELVWGKDVVAENAETGYEICTTICQGSASGTLKGEFRSLGGIAVDQATGAVYVWDQRGGSTTATNVRIQKFDADGNFILMFGKGVNETTGGDVCTEASGDVCKNGTPGNAAGQLGSFINRTRLAVAPSGEVFVADPANRRIQQFEPDGDFVRAWGWGVDSGAGALQICTAASTCQGGLTTSGSDNGRFGASQPIHIAIDSAGIVYASDSNTSNRVLRFDPSAIPGPATAGAAPPGFLLSAIGVPPLLNGVTSGLKVEYDSDAGGADTDRLLVARDPSAGETIVQEVGGLEVPAGTPTVVDTDAVGDGFGTVSSLGINSLSGDLYLGSQISVGSGSEPAYFILDADGTEPVEVEIEAPVNVEATSADLSGEVNPGGGDVTYRFEYSTNGTDWTALPEGNLNGTGFQPVSTALTGLDPNTTYRARLIAEKIIGPNTLDTAASSEAIFLTDSAPPQATTRPVHSYTDESAWLAGDVDPNGTATTYRFEWGLSKTYTHQTPLPEGSAGSSGSPKSYLHEIDGLKPSTTYHYRLVAESDEGVSLGSDRTFTTRPAFKGFPARAYEQVSPVFKNAGAINHDRILAEGSAAVSAGSAGYSAAVAEDGSAAVFASADVFADAEWGANTAASEVPLFYQARRNADGSGWTTKATVPRAPSLGESGQNGVSIAPTLYGGLADGMAAFDSQTFSMTGPTPPNSGGGYIRDWASGGLTTLFEGLSNSIGGTVVGASADFEQIFFETTLVLTADPGVPASGTKLYEWRNGQVRLVGLDESGTPFSTPVRLGRSSGGVERTAVSDDGRHAFFSAGPGGQSSIYRRSDGTTTTLVSPSKASVPDPLGPKGKVFSAASDDGGRVFFMSAEQLTDDANTGPAREGNDLYRYDVSTDTLVDLSAESNDVAGARVRGILGTSELGDTVYYVARGQVLADEGEAGANNIYRWHDDGSAEGETQFIATLAQGSTSNSVHPNDNANLGADSSIGSIRDQQQTARVSADGKTLLFQSTATQTGYRSHGFSQAYVYEADANGGSGQLSCVSCPPNGAAPAAHSYVPYGGIPSESGDAPTRVLSDDGSRVFFNSEADLIPTDTNGVQDVYVWEEGRIDLVSTGEGTTASFLHGASGSGDDVFIVTANQLVGQDEDGQMDVYDYRVGGGIPQQSPPPPGEPCLGSGCKPPQSTPPVLPSVTSTAVSGAGNVKDKPARGRKCPAGKRRVKSKGRVRCVPRRRANRLAARTKRSDQTRKRGHK